MSAIDTESPTPPLIEAPTKTKEVPEATQTNETKIIGRNLIQTKTREVVDEVDRKGGSESPGEKRLAFIGLLEYNDGDFTNRGQKKGYEFTEAENVLIRADNGLEGTLQEVKGRKGEMYICKITTSEGSADVDVPRDALIGALFVSGSDSIQQLFTDPVEQQVLQQYFSWLKGEKPATPLPPEQLNEVLTRNANKVGLLSSENVQKFLQSEMGRHLSPAQQSGVAELITKLNVLDSSAVKELMEKIGFDRNHLQNTLQQQIQHLLTLPQTPESVQQIAQCTELLNTVQKTANLDEQVANYFFLVDTGEIDHEQAQVIISAFEKGNIEQVLQSIVSTLQAKDADSPEEQERKRKQAEMLAKLLSEGESLGGGILFYLALAGIAMGKEIVK